MKMRNRLLKTYRAVSLVFRHLTQLFSETLEFQKQPFEGDQNFVTQPTYSLERESHPKKTKNLIHDLNLRVSLFCQTEGQLQDDILARHKIFLDRILRTDGVKFKYVSALQFVFALPIFPLRMSWISGANKIFHILETHSKKESQSGPDNYSICWRRYAQNLQKLAQARTYNAPNRLPTILSTIRRVQTNQLVQMLLEGHSYDFQKLNYQANQLNELPEVELLAKDGKSFLENHPEALTTRIQQQYHYRQSAAQQLKSLAFSRPQLFENIYQKNSVFWLTQPLTPLKFKRRFSQRHDGKNLIIDSIRSVNILSKESRFTVSIDRTKLFPNREELIVSAARGSLLKSRTPKLTPSGQEKAMKANLDITEMMDERIEETLINPGLQHFIRFGNTPDLHLNGDVNRKLRKISRLGKQSVPFIFERDLSYRRDAPTLKMTSNRSVTVSWRRSRAGVSLDSSPVVSVENSPSPTDFDRTPILSKGDRLKDMNTVKKRLTRREHQTVSKAGVSLRKSRSSKLPIPKQEKPTGTNGTYLRPLRYATVSRSRQSQTTPMSMDVRQVHTFQTLKLIEANSAKPSLSQKVINGVDTPTLIHPKQAQTQSPISKPVATSQTDRSNFPIPLVRPHGIVEPPGMRQSQDIERLSNQVIQVIEERLKTEQERRGIFI